MRRKTLRRSAVFAITVGFGMTAMVAGTTLTAPIALAAGANQPGPYDPTPSAGDNQGNGNAPDNGTVGNADDKNPPGQQPGGSDNNKGYECDGNKGVGDNGGNPAHTGCTEQTDDNGGGGSGSGGGVDQSTPPVGEVLGETLTATTPPAGDVAGETVTAPAVEAAAATAPAQLPFTGPGTLTVALAIAGALMVLFGLALVTATKEPTFA